MIFEGHSIVRRMIDPNHNRPMAQAKIADVVRFMARVTCLALAMAALSACSKPADCSGGDYHGGCVPGAGGPAIEPPAAVSPAAVAPAAVSPGVAPVTVARGDPATFADVDDKQCRSYGLIFGSRDYADCRLRLSAQHHGLDPNIGTGSPGSGNR